MRGKPFRLAAVSTLSILLFLFFCGTTFAEDVTVSTYFPSPYGNYRQLQVQENSSGLAADFTQAVTRAGISIITDFVANNFTPGIFWSTSNNNQGIPKAGIWMQETNAGSRLLFGASSNTGAFTYAGGINNASPGMTLDQNGNLGIRTAAPTGPLHVVGTNDATSNAIFMPGTDTAAAGVPNIRMGIGTAAPLGPLHIVGANDATSSVILAPGTDTATAGVPAIQMAIGTTTPNASAILDLSSTTQALLVPRMTTTERNSVATLTNGMILYNTTVPQFEGQKPDGGVGSSNFLGQKIGSQVIKINDALTNGADSQTIALSGYPGAKKVLFENLTEVAGGDGYAAVNYYFLNSSGTTIVSILAAQYYNANAIFKINKFVSGIGDSQLVDIPTLATQLRISLTINTSLIPRDAANGQAKVTVTFYQ